MMNDQPTVYIVDDDEQSRKAIGTLVQTMGIPFHCYASAEEFLESYNGHRPACLVTDVRMIGMSGLELQERLIRSGVTISVVVLTAYATTPTTVRAMRNGALTLIEKPCDDDELWEAIRTGLTADEKNHALEQSRMELMRRFDLLTPKERSVLDYVVAGDPNKIVARKMGVSIRTVENHRHKIFHKLQADSVAELVRMAISVGIIPDSKTNRLE